MSEYTYILHQWRIRCLNTLRYQMIVDLNPPSTIQHKDVYNVLSILGGYETLHTTQTSTCPLSLITYRLKSVHLEYYLTLRHSAILWKFTTPGIKALLQQLIVIFQ